MLLQKKSDPFITQISTHATLQSGEAAFLVSLLKDLFASSHQCSFCIRHKFHDQIWWIFYPNCSQEAFNSVWDGNAGLDLLMDHVVAFLALIWQLYEFLVRRTYLTSNECGFQFWIMNKHSLITICADSNNMLCTFLYKLRWLSPLLFLSNKEYCDSRNCLLSSGLLYGWNRSKLVTMKAVILLRWNFS